MKLDNLHHTLIRDFSCVPTLAYQRNLELVQKIAHIPGDIVECGVFKGGMIAGIARTLGNGRRYRLFDSFAGMPPAKDIDGLSIDGFTAKEWQADPQHGNTTAHESIAIEAMKLVGIDNYEIHKGFFEDTLHKAKFPDGIALLRVDCDWYDSVYHTFDMLFPHVNPGGLIIIDDYYYWEGCPKAVHDYLSHNKRHECMHEYGGPHDELAIGDSNKGHGVAFMMKSRTFAEF